MGDCSTGSSSSITYKKDARARLDKVSIGSYIIQDGVFAIRDRVRGVDKVQTLADEALRDAGVLGLASGSKGLEQVVLVEVTGHALSSPSPYARAFLYR